MSLQANEPSGSSPKTATAVQISQDPSSPKTIENEPVSQKRLERLRREEEVRLASARVAAPREALWKDAAEEVPRDLLSELPPAFKSFTTASKNRAYDFEYLPGSALGEADRATLVRILATNMKEAYLRNWNNWNEKKKLKELTHREARHILVRDHITSEIVGFAHVRFLYEDDAPVLYLYEIQFEDARQGEGLGTRLMLVLEILARKTTRCEWFMLTVFADNVKGRALYARLGFEVDDNSPDPKEDKEIKHYILSKRLI